MQAEDRAHRIGQRDCVNVQYLLAKGTFDDTFWPLILKKLDVLEAVGLSKNEFKDTKAIELNHDENQMKITDHFLPLKPKDGGAAKVVNDNNLKPKPQVQSRQKSVHEFFTFKEPLKDRSILSNRTGRSDVIVLDDDDEDAFANRPVRPIKKVCKSVDADVVLVESTQFHNVSDDDDDDDDLLMAMMDEFEGEQ
jgi:hypothetical protein